MSFSPRSTSLIIWVLTLTCLVPAHSLATLGEGYDSIANDSKALSAALRSITTHSKYTVQEVATEGTVVREYLTPSGVVFAIAWKGMVIPDLTVLLGSYAEDYWQAKRLQPRLRGQKRSRVIGDRVVVETWGQMRNLQGRAYDPALIPDGVAANEIY